MEAFLPTLFIALGAAIVTATLACLWVHLASKKLVAQQATTSKAVALTLSSFGVNWIFHSFLQHISTALLGSSSQVNTLQLGLKIMSIFIAWLLIIATTLIGTSKMYCCDRSNALKIAGGPLVIISVANIASIWRYIDWWLHSAQMP